MLSLRQNILVAKKAAAEEDKKWYSATVLDLYDNEALISLPGIGEEVMDLTERAILEVSFVDGGARYHFESGVTQTFGREALAIELPETFEKIDLRKYPRMPVCFEVFFAESGSGDEGREYKKGCMLDISGNGMRITADQVYAPGTAMSVKFSLPVEIEGQVVRVVVNDLEDPVEFQLGLTYSGVEKALQEMIIKYVNKQLSEENNNKRADGVRA